MQNLEQEIGCVMNVERYTLLEATYECIKKLMNLLRFSTYVLSVQGHIKAVTVWRCTCGDILRIGHISVQCVQGHFIGITLLSFIS